MSKTHKFRITVTTGAGRFAPGEPVPVGGKTGISPEEIASIENVHGKWIDDGTPGLPVAAARSAEVAAANTRIDLLMAVIAAHETVDAAAHAVGAENAPDTALDDLAAAEAVLAEARKAAGLPALDTGAK